MKDSLVIQGSPDAETSLNSQRLTPMGAQLGMTCMPVDRRRRILIPFCATDTASTWRGQVIKRYQEGYGLGRSPRVQHRFGGLLNPRCEGFFVLSHRDLFVVDGKSQGLLKIRPRRHRHRAPSFIYRMLRWSNLAVKSMVLGFVRIP